jgi:type IV pilus assembly protein PilY1
MKSPITQKLVLAVTLFMAATSAVAEDIDIYQANNTSATSNLLLVIDNSGAWNAAAPTASATPALDCPTAGAGKILDPTLANSAGGVETCGIWKAVDTIGNTPALNGKLNMGLMLFSTGSVQGGTFKFPAVATPTSLVNMTSGAGGGIEQMKGVLSGLKSSGGSSDTANGTDVGGAMQEAWAFYSGKTGVSGRTYPGINADTCGKNFVIFIGISRVSSDPADFNANQVFAALNSAGASTEQKTFINWTTNNRYSRATNYWGDEWTRFSKQNNAITTYTITLVDPGNPNPDYERFMRSMADASGGKAFVVDVSDMNAFVQALLQIFNEIQAVNSVFAAASLPISTNATGSFLNQIYFGMFRPDGAGLPRWAGNLKQYRFALDAADPLHPRLYLADSRPNDPLTGLPFPAINSAGTGFFSPNAISYWTTKDITSLPDNIDPTGALAVNGGVAGGFFIFNPQSAGAGFDLPDGEIVEKGGVAQRIRLENLVNNYANAPGTTGNSRRLYTCITGCNAGSLLSDSPFAPSNTNVLNHPGLGAGVAGTPIATLTRTDALASVTLSSAMSPVLVNGQSVFVTGPTINDRYRGNVPAGNPPTATTFTYPITVLPPVSATGSGYTATIGGIPVAITSITRSGATATVQTAVPHGFGLQTVTIAGAGTGYDNGAALITSTPTVDTFTYNIIVSPPVTVTGSASAIFTNVTTGGATRAIDGIVRGAPAAGTPFAATANIKLASNRPGTWAVGDTFTIAGLDATYNSGGSNPATYRITGLGGSAAPNDCPGSAPNTRVCFTIDTGPGAATITAATQASIPSANVGISSITRGTSCTGGTPTPVTTATVITSAAHPFATGTVVTISGGDAKSALYTGNVTLVTGTPGTNTFTYNVTTDPPCSDNSPGKTASAGGADPASLINWVRGKDDLGDEASPGGAINVRPSVHGDVLHSRPAVVNYGGTTGVVLFYGANNGVFHAVNGNQTDPIGTVPAGGELWGFVASEFYPKLMRQYLNSPVVKLEATPTSILPAPQPKDYFFDGSIGVYKSGSTVHLYLTARRGGRVIYALDVSNPAAPRFMWKKTNVDLPELGQTWSTPKVVKVKGYANPVLIFGAGYDPAEDAEPPTARSMGRGIFILDALDGSTVWQATGGGGTNSCTGTPCQLLDMTYPIPSDVTTLDRDISDLGEYVDRIYVGDLGGNIWRVDLEPTVGGNLPANWKVTKFASVGGTGTTKRKIFFPPDVVPTRDFDAVLFSTGDREHPTRTQQSVNILNRFYMLKDTATGNDGNTTPVVDSTSSTACVGALPKTPASCVEAVPTDLFNASAVLPTSASTVPATAGPAYDDSGNGFYINLLNALPRRQTDGSFLYGPEIQAGEKAVNAPTTIGGNTFFGTNAPIPPDPGVCQPNLGTARGYAINFISGAFDFAVFDGGGLPPSPVAGVVDIGGTLVPFVIGGVKPAQDGQTDLGKQPGGSALGGGEVEITVKALRTRTYWYRDIGNR